MPAREHTPPGKSPAQRLVEAGKLEEFLLTLTEAEAQTLLRDWAGFWARPSQRPPDGDWDTWLVDAGRGFGKTRTGGETTVEWAEEAPRRRIALIGPTRDDVRKTMVEGESGILSLRPEWAPGWNRSETVLTCPNGTLLLGYSSEEPERLRGPQHHYAWGDEPAAWAYPDETWDMLWFGLRLREVRPRVVLTTTPKPIKLIKDLLDDELVVVTRGSTYDNASNLAPATLAKYRRRYEGTALGDQELHARMLEDVKGALWRRAWIDARRIKLRLDALGRFEDEKTARARLHMRRVVVALDPSQSDEGDEMGVIGAGVDARGDEGYLLADRSGQMSPEEHIEAGVQLYDELEADAIVVETNCGGPWVPGMIRSHCKAAKRACPPIRMVRAARGKATRGEPISGLSQQGRIAHLGTHGALEDQLTTWIPGKGKSPGRLDAYVWAFWDLMVDGAASGAEELRAANDGPETVPYIDERGAL